MARPTALTILFVLFTTSIAGGQETFARRPKPDNSSDRRNLDLKLPPLNIPRHELEHSTLRRLQVERLRTAEKILRMYEGLYERGVMPRHFGRTPLVFSLGTAQLRAIESRLDLATALRERIEILETGVRIARRTEMVAKHREQLQLGDHVSLPLATYRRLEFEIRLEREKLKLRQCP